MDTTTGSGLEIRRVSIDSLTLDPANARAHGDANIMSIVGSLKRFGQAEPLVVHKPTGRVIGGNGRLVAMQKLGWTECDVVELEINDLDATALGIALNRTAELAEWDNPALARLLEQLREEDALVGVGFDDADIDELLNELEMGEPGEVNDQGPGTPPETPISQLGDLWTLGNHRLMCGDSTDAADVERLVGSDTPVLMATDPPYVVGYTGADRPGNSGKDWSATFRETEIEDLGEFLRDTFKATLPRLTDNAGIYIWHAHLKLPVLVQVFEEFGLLAHQPIIWAKPSSTFEDK